MISRRRGGLLLFATAVVVVGIGLSLLELHMALYQDHFTEGEEEVVSVEIPHGASVRSAARLLHEAGLLDAPWKLRLVHRLHGGASTIQAGLYRIRRGSSPERLLHLLEEGRVALVRVTIPEGWTKDRTCGVLADSLHLDRQKLLELSRRPPVPWRKELDLPAGADLEGYLFPETYRFADGISEELALHTLLRHFLAVFDETMRADALREGLTVHEAVTLASIVEAETSLPEEKKKVAAVYLNRLRKGWKLEADPTVAFAVGKPGERLSYRDLQIDSPYNTYRVKGLPPGPINSPGREALDAVVHPQQDFDALYFVADGKGGHVFSRTWEEHRAAVRAYRAARRAHGVR